MTMRKGGLAGVLVTVAVLAWAAGASADVSSDYLHVRADWQSHGGKITRCRFRANELRNVLTAISANPDEDYSDFRPAVEGELARISAKLCRGTVPESARRSTALGPARIAKLKGSGGPARE